VPGGEVWLPGISRRGCVVLVDARGAATRPAFARRSHASWSSACRLVEQRVGHAGSVSVNGSFGARHGRSLVSQAGESLVLAVRNRRAFPSGRDTIHGASYHLDHKPQRRACYHRPQRRPFPPGSPGTRGPPSRLVEKWRGETRSDRSGWSDGKSEGPVPPEPSMYKRRMDSPVRAYCRRL